MPRPRPQTREEALDLSHDHIRDAVDADDFAFAGRPIVEALAGVVYALQALSLPPKLVPLAVAAPKVTPDGIASSETVNIRGKGTTHGSMFVNGQPGTLCNPGGGWDPQVTVVSAQVTCPDCRTRIGEPQ